MKILKILFLCCITFCIVSCKKEPLPTLVKPDCCMNMKEIGYVRVNIYLIDFDTMNFVDEQGHIIGNDNGNGYPNHFVVDTNGTAGYALTKCKGKILDSIPLSIFDNTRNALRSNFDFVVGFYPNDVDSLKINKFNETTLEIYSGHVKLGSALIGEYGFYGDTKDYDVRAFTTLHPTRTNYICTRM